MTRLVYETPKTYLSEIPIEESMGSSSTTNDPMNEILVRIDLCSYFSVFIGML